MKSHPESASDLRSIEERLPRSIRAILHSCPTRGEGLNNWCIRIAHRLHRCGFAISESSMEALIDAHAGAGIKLGEALRAIRKSHPANPRTHTTQACPKWPQRNLAEIEKIALMNPGLPGLRAVSEVPGDSLQTVEILENLFPGNPLLCIGVTLENCETLRLSEWRTIVEGNQFIVPSAMSARVGKTQDGRESYRTMSNTGPRQFLVVEFDFREKDSQGLDTPAGPMLRRLAEWLALCGGRRVALSMTHQS